MHVRHLEPAENYCTRNPPRKCSLSSPRPRQVAVSPSFGGDRRFQHVQSDRALLEDIAIQSRSASPSPHQRTSWSPPNWTQPRAFGLIIQRYATNGNAMQNNLPRISTSKQVIFELLGPNAEISLKEPIVPAVGQPWKRCSHSRFEAHHVPKQPTLTRCRSCIGTIMRLLLLLG